MLKIFRSLALVAVLLGLAAFPASVGVRAVEDECGCELLGEGWICSGECDCPCEPTPCTCGCSSCTHIED